MTLGEYTIKLLILTALILACAVAAYGLMKDAPVFSVPECQGEVK